MVAKLDAVGEQAGRIDAQHFGGAQGGWRGGWPNLGRWAGNKPFGPKEAKESGCVVLADIVENIGLAAIFERGGAG